MTNKEKFKTFIANKPELASFVNNGQMTWQKFYEMYDLYGEENKVWDTYLHANTLNENKADTGINKINDLIKNVDINSIKEHINTAQKALDFVQELTGKTNVTNPIHNVVEPRPLNKFFED